MLTSVSASDISWIGSIQSFLLFVGGLAAGPLFDHGYLRSLIYVGSFLVVFGMMMTSTSYLYWHVVLAQGIVVGFGCACFFIPSVAIVRLYFGKRRALAMGVAASGSSIGKYNNSTVKLYKTHHCRRGHLSHRFSTTATKAWVCLGNPRSCFYDASYLDLSDSCVEDASTSIKT